MQRQHPPWRTAVDAAHRDPPRTRPSQRLRPPPPVALPLLDTSLSWKRLRWPSPPFREEAAAAAQDDPALSGTRRLPSARSPDEGSGPPSPIPRTKPPPLPSASGTRPSPPHAPSRSTKQQDCACQQQVRACHQWRARRHAQMPACAFLLTRQARGMESSGHSHLCGPLFHRRSPG